MDKVYVVTAYIIISINSFSKHILFVIRLYGSSRFHSLELQNVSKDFFYDSKTYQQWIIISFIIVCLGAYFHNWIIVCIGTLCERAFREDLRPFSWFPPWLISLAPENQYLDLTN